MFYFIQKENKKVGNAVCYNLPGECDESKVLTCQFMDGAYKCM